MRYNQEKGMHFFCFYCSENPSIAHNFGITGPIQVRVSAKCTSLNEHFNEIETEKCLICDPAPLNEAL